ncbi:MAG TPA: UvrD-helicase domain-containing protein [Galbitalea sp.]|nr:UvrD-helicase domain-containing protein [Galbitalea sp.]
MTAASSADVDSRREMLLAEKRERTAALARRAAARYQVQPHVERDVLNALSPLIEIGYHLLPNRGWPGNRSAQVDLIVVGPSGLYIVDTKSWSDVTIENGRVYRQDADVTDDLASLADLAYTTEAAMADIGLAPGEVHALVVLAGNSNIHARIGTVEMIGESGVASYILQRGLRFTQSQFRRVLAASLDYFPVVAAPMQRTITAQHAGDQPVDELTDPTHVPGHLAIPEQIPTITSAGLMSQVAAVVKEPPVEEWMAFLDPEQARLVRRSFNGPSRIRGAVGTGKTIVGLHRAAYLARTQPGIVLVTSFVSTLPAAQASLMRRLAPDIRERIEFVGTQSFAKRLLSDRGVRTNLQPAIADAEFEIVWRTVGKPGLLGQLEAKSTYWEDEIDHVIKGRGITTFEEYAAIERTGRLRRLSIEQRQAMWELFTAYQARMLARGAHDEADIILLAEQSLRGEPLDRYEAVIVDEAQDLSAAMVRMLHHLVGDKPDGLTLIGDYKQSIYPGGFSLGEVGISLAGRGVVLNTNYRNTAEILRFAESLVSGNDFIDIEGARKGSADDVDVPRSGPAPLLVRFSNRAAHDIEIPRRVRALVADDGISYGDIGILALTTFGVRAAIASLQKANIPVLELTHYDGSPVDAVKVGTIKRAKGLEFKQVLLVQVPATLLPGEHDLVPPEEGAAAEQTELQKRQLYVAMTRARDGLWVGTIP